MAEDGSPSRLLLVEGVDDKHVVRHICGRQRDMPDFCIRETDGFSNLAAAISPEIKAPGRTALGIVVDANDDLSARWQTIGDHMRRAEVNPPTRTAPAGTLVEGRPRVGIWLMPDNQSTGELEDFIERLMPDGDPVWPRARSYIEDIPAADRRFATGKILRARIHAWLATRAEPRKMGAAIGFGDLNATAPLAGQFVDWLRRLFDVSQRR